MNIYIYSDESGVLDKKHNEYFCFGGVVFLSKDERDIAVRKYLSAENAVRRSEGKATNQEVKANSVSNKNKGKLYRSLNSFDKFGAIIKQEWLSDRLFANKKEKQRYLDWAYKMAVKEKLKAMISAGAIEPEKVKNIYFYIDEHSTATNGIYELRESLEREFKFGVSNFAYNSFYLPLFPSLDSVSVKFCDSKNNVMVRAADVVANKVFFSARQSGKMDENDRLKIFYHPNCKSITIASN